MSAPDDEVTTARLAIGLSADRYANIGGGITTGQPIVCRCIHCGTLFASKSHDLSDLDYICMGDCGKHEKAPR